jgi:hypothetical protein|tara:strand:+ start:1125 stop:2087 length:963 start_codon:yes stop_codon:yes gene_type:complete
MKNNNVNTLSENATLVRFTTKHPSGIKSDKDLRKGLAIDKEANNDSLHVAKYIFGKETNKYFRRIINQFRYNYFYPMTVPWDDNTSDYEGKVLSGWRLCPNRELDRLMDKANESKSDFQKEVDSFLDNYENLIEANKHKLGQAFKLSDYPNKDVIATKFRFDFELGTVPQFNTKDVRLNVSEKLRKKIEQDALKRATKNVEAITRTTVDTLLESVEHLADKLKSYDPKTKGGGFFKNSSFDKLRQFLDTLPSINADILGNDKTIAEAHQNLVSVFAKINDVDSLRDDDDYTDKKRKQLADDLKDSVDELKGGFLDDMYKK